MGEESFPYVPQPPTWRVDWESIESRFAWIRAMAGVPQEPAYHGEGDVLTHTRMVAEALAALPAWRALPPDARAILFAAALLHDVAKPACTRVEPAGRIVSPGHAKIGERLARHALWTGEGLDAETPPAVREAVARLVRWHGLPLWLLEKPDPLRAAIVASMTTRLAWVALLAEADVRGRICPDKDALLERIELFRLFCEEAGCYTGPRQFASDHSRFVYFRSPNGHPDYAAYDDTACEVTLMVGLPGAGKDTWVRGHCAGLPVVSLDAIRRDLGIGPREPQGAVAAEAKAQARELLRRHQSFVWNATNVTHATRAPLIDLFAAYHARVRIVYVDAPFEALLARNRARPDHVPEAVVARLARRLEVPDLTEAHAVGWTGAS